MTPEAALLLLALLTGHFLGDFTPLVTERMTEAKAAGGPLGPILGHAAVHGALTGVAALAVVRPDPSTLALAAGIELVTHFVLDAVRARLGARFEGLRDPKRQLFWTGLGLDQLAHGAVLVGIAALLL